jgi:2,3-bisphosphoglycerate-dependent phosphoglycerate mutase
VLWLVRHGQSTWNTLGLAQGHRDQARLTQRGARQARIIAARLYGRPVRALFTSDLCRARQTAAPLAWALGLPARPDTRLRERSLGVLEGMPTAAISPSRIGLDPGPGRVADPDVRPASGESIRDLYRRVAAFVDELAGPAWLDPSRGDVVVVAHGGTLRVLDAYLHGVPVEQMRWLPVGNACILHRRLAYT